MSRAEAHLGVLGTCEALATCTLGSEETLRQKPGQVPELVLGNISQPYARSFWHSQDSCNGSQAMLKRLRSKYPLTFSSPRPDALHIPSTTLPGCGMPIVSTDRGPHVDRIWHRRARRDKDL